MARIFAFVAVYLAFTGVQAIRSEDDLHEGAMQHSSGIEKDVAKMVCEQGFKWEWPAYPQLGQKDHPCCEEAKKCVQGKANAACPMRCNLKAWICLRWFFYGFYHSKLGGGFTYFLFSPLLGEDSHFH